MNPMFKIRSLLPKNKFDDSNLEKIKRLSNAEIAPIIPDLLVWLQDYNWPVSHPVLLILIERQDLVFPYIHEILAGSDVMWTYWVLELLIPKLKKSYQNELRKDIEELASLAQTDEDTVEIVERAKLCMKRCFQDSTCESLSDPAVKV